MTPEGLIRGPLKVIADSDSPAIQIQQEGNGNAIEIVDAAGNVLSTVDRKGSRATIAPLRQPLRPNHTMISSFQTGHGWSQVGAASSNLNDTTAGNYILGSQAVTVSLNASGTVNLKKTGMAAIDMTAAYFKVWLMVDDITNLSQINIYAGDTSLANFYFTTFLDGVGSGLPFASGEWVEITVPFHGMTVTGTPNQAAITDIQLQAKTTAGGSATVHFGGIAKVPNPTPFPNGVVSISFDDTLSSQFTQGRLKLDQYGYGATAYTIVGNVGQPVGMTLAQLHELEDMHGWEVGGHAYSLANHNNDFFADASIAAADLAQLRLWLQSNGFRGCDHFAYPHGTMSVVSTVEAAAKKYFASARTTYALPRPTLPPSRPSRMRGYIVSNTTTTATIQTEVDRAYTAGTWLHLIFHDIVTTPSTTTQYSIANFGTVVDYLNTKGIPVRTVGDVLSTLSAVR
jgi:hypothetical protein